MFLVSGGDDGQYATAFDSTETFDPLVGTWATSGAKLPRPMAGARGIIINDRLLIFGIITYFLVLLPGLILRTLEKS